VPKSQARAPPTKDDLHPDHANFLILMLAEYDIGQVIIIVVAMIAGFIQWLWSNIQERMEAKKRQQRQRDVEIELTLSESGRHLAPPPTHPLPGNSEPSSVPPRGVLGDFIEGIKEEIRKAQAELEPASAPVRPMPQVPPPLRRHLPQPPASVPATPKPAQTSAPVLTAETKPAQVATKRDDFEVLRSSVRNPEALRNAFILREILGPPKALQSEGI
jgi:hypothetical protein